MTEFFGSPILGTTFEAEDISVNTTKITSHVTDMTNSSTVLKEKFTEFETESDTYVTYYEGDSGVEYNNAYKVLQFRQEKLQTVFTDLAGTLNRNAFLNTRINTMANQNAGGE